MKEQEYLGVGQLARKVNTTVRTIQYYDQQGLLSPSAKGPANQRLYTPEDVDKLQRILTLKYLGLSLADIRDKKDSVDDPEAFREVLERAMESLEDDFQHLVKRLSVLRALLSRTSETDRVDWALLSQAIDEGEASSLVWGQIDEMQVAPADAEPEPMNSHDRGLAVSKWHELIADAITLMSDHIAPDDERTAELAQRYRQLEEAESGSLAQMFILAENVTPHRGTSGSFNVLRDSVEDYLKDVKRSHGDAGEGDAQ